MKKNALSSERLKALFPQTPQAFSDFVEHRLNDLKVGRETPVMKKKLSTGMVIALILTLLIVAAAVAAIISPTADVFGFLYGGKKQEALLNGDIAKPSMAHQSGKLIVTLEEVIYQAEGEMTGLYGTGTVVPAEGANLVLVPEDVGPDSAIEFSQFFSYYGKEEQAKENALSYREMAKQKGAKLIQVRVFIEQASVDGQALQSDAGYTLIPMPDGGIRFACELSGDGVRRAEAYDLTMYLGWQELDAQGAPGELHSDNWTVHVTPQLSQTAKAEIAAATPAPALETEAPMAVLGALKVAGGGWGEADDYALLHPDRAVEHVTENLYDTGDYLKNPENPWDVALFFMEDVDFGGLMQSGQLMDLSGDSVIQGQTDRMIPRVKDAVSQDGKVYALPVGMFGGNVALEKTDARIWEGLGWTEDMAPKTFAELCALAETYMALPLQTRKGTRFVEGDSVFAARNLLLDQLVQLYSAEALAKGQAAVFDTQAFREGLRQMEQAAQALDGKQAAPDAENRRYMLFYDAGPSLVGENDLNLRFGDAPAYPVRLYVCVINENSGNKAAALDFVRWLAENLSGQFLPMLDGEISANEIAKRSIAQNIANSQLYGGQEEDLAELRKRQQSGDISGYGPTEKALELYRREVAPNLTILTKKQPDTYEIRTSYLKGQLDADGFISALQQAEDKKQ